MNADFFVVLWGLLKNGLLALGILTVLDIIFGVLVAVFIKKDFKWVYLDHFLTSDVLPIFAWVGTVIITSFPLELIPAGVQPVVSGTIYASVFIGILASILESFSAIGILTSFFPKIGIGGKDTG